MKRWTAIAAALLVAACGDDAVRPPDSAPPANERAFYPLLEGSWWERDNRLTIRFLDDTGSPVRPDQVVDVTTVHVLVGEEEIAGVTYMVEREWAFAPGGVDTLVSWRRFRQDEGGLYRADISFAVPLGATSDYDEVYDIQVLSYPLAADAEWEMWPASPPPTAKVEALETVSLPGGDVEAYRLRLQTPEMGPEDERLVWYGRCGLVRRTYHSEIFAFDPTTSKLIVLVREEDVSLSAIDVTGNDACDAID